MDYHSHSNLSRISTIYLQIMEPSTSVTGKRVSKRLLKKGGNLSESPKKLRYNPSSDFMEQRDMSYCDAINKNSLRHLRISSEEEDITEECEVLNKQSLRHLRLASMEEDIESQESGDSLSGTDYEVSDLE